MNLPWGVSKNGELLAAFCSKDVAEDHATQLRICLSDIAVVEVQPTFLRMPGVIARTGMSKPWIYGNMKTGKFPKSIPIGAHTTTVVWLEHEVDEWVRSTIRAAVEYGQRRSLGSDS